MRLVVGNASQSREEVFGRIAVLARERAGLAPVMSSTTRVRTPVPYVSEPWYCCAEPMEIL